MTTIQIKNIIPKFVVIDGNHLIHRAFYAIRTPLATSAGEPTNALYGFAGMLLNIIEREDPDYIAMTFDEKTPTFRHKAHKEYKATRSKAPDELYIQIPRIRELVKSFNISIFSSAGYEADDLMGTLALSANSQGIKTCIVTGDMDMFQLIQPNIVVAFPHKGYREPFIYQEKEVFDKYGIFPNQVVDYKALVGDSSDNIRGVDGIGPKGAGSLLAQYKTLDGIYDHLDEIREGVRSKLIRDRDQAYFARTLATIVTDVPCEFKIEALSLDQLDYLNLFKFCEKMEMISLMNRLKKIIPANRLADKSQMSLF